MPSGMPSDGQAPILDSVTPDPMYTAPLDQLGGQHAQPVAAEVQAPPILTQPNLAGQVIPDNVPAPARPVIETTLYRSGPWVISSINGTMPLAWNLDRIQVLEVVDHPESGGAAIGARVDGGALRVIGLFATRDDAEQSLFGIILPGVSRV